MTYIEAARIILNICNINKTWDEPVENEIHDNDSVRIAMRMAYDVLIEKAEKINLTK